MLAEIALYQPKLIVVAHGNYAVDLVHSIFGEVSSPDWQKEDDKKIWWKRQQKGMPDIILIEHPERKRMELITYWLEISKMLLRSE